MSNLRWYNVTYTKSGDLAVLAESKDDAQKVADAKWAEGERPEWTNAEVSDVDLEDDENIQRDLWVDAITSDIIRMDANYKEWAKQYRGEDGHICEAYLSHLMTAVKRFSSDEPYEQVMNSWVPVGVNLMLWSRFNIEYWHQSVRGYAVKFAECYVNFKFDSSVNADLNAAAYTALRDSIDCNDIANAARSLDVMRLQHIQTTISMAGDLVDLAAMHFGVDSDKYNQSVVCAARLALSGMKKKRGKTGKRGTDISRIVFDLVVDLVKHRDDRDDK